MEIYDLQGIMVRAGRKTRIQVETQWIFLNLTSKDACALHSSDFSSMLVRSHADRYRHLQASLPIQCYELHVYLSL